MKTQTNTNNENAKPVKLLTTREAASLWNISRWTVFALVKKGDIRPIVGVGKGWRFIGDELNSVSFERL